MYHTYSGFLALVRLITNEQGCSLHPLRLVHTHLCRGNQGYLRDSCPLQHSNDMGVSTRVLVGTDRRGVDFCPGFFLLLVGLTCIHKCGFPALGYSQASKIIPTYVTFYAKPGVQREKLISTESATS